MPVQTVVSLFRTALLAVASDKEVEETQPTNPTHGKNQRPQNTSSPTLFTPIQAKYFIDYAMLTYATKSFPFYFITCLLIHSYFVHLLISCLCVSGCFTTTDFSKPFLPHTNLSEPSHSHDTFNHLYHISKLPSRHHSYLFTFRKQRKVIRIHLTRQPQTILRLRPTTTILTIMEMVTMDQPNQRVNQAVVRVFQQQNHRHQ